MLVVGEDEWPFPFPLVKEEGAWRFDSSGGVDEIINRRVGTNELSTIQSCLAYVDAQSEYYLGNPEGSEILHYARKLISTDGKKDGLFWETVAGEPESPLGAEFANARAEGLRGGRHAAYLALSRLLLPGARGAGTGRRRWRL